MNEKTRRQTREDARRLFLTGECTTNAEIAKSLGVKPHTIARYRREEAWDDLRLKIDRQAAEKLVEQLAGERTSLNLRHYTYWDVLLSHAGSEMKAAERLGVRELDRLAAIIDRAQRGQRLARGLSLTGENEEQIRAQAQAEMRELIDAFVEAVKTNVPDVEARERLRQAVLEHLPSTDPTPRAEGKGASS